MVNLDIDVIELDNCPSGQLSKVHPNDAGYDLMISEDAFIPTIQMLDEAEAYTWERMVDVNDVETNLLMTIQDSGMCLIERDESDGKTYIYNKRYKFPLLGTGIILRAKEPCWFGIYSRSGMSTKYNTKLANGVGVVDFNYQGPNDEIKITLCAEHTGIFLPRGTRVAQLITHPHYNLNMNRMPKSMMEGTNNRGGFGSTGYL